MPTSAAITRMALLVVGAGLILLGSLICVLAAPARRGIRPRRRDFLFPIRTKGSIMIESQWVLYSPFLRAYIAIDADGDMVAVTKQDKAARWEDRPGHRRFLGVRWVPREADRASGPT